MDRFLMEELKDRCNEIYLDKDNTQMISKVIEAYERICNFVSIGRNEGLLALEEAKDGLDSTDDAESIFYDQITLVVDGTEPVLVKIMGVNRCISANLHSYLGLIGLMYVQGSLMIQAGDTMFVVEQMLKSMMPKFIVEQLRKAECEKVASKVTVTVKDIVADLCKGDTEINDNDHSVACETSKTLLMLSDKDIQRLLKEINESTLSMAMKGLPGKVRARVFENMSPRLSIMLAERISYMGPVPMKYVEEDCVSMMKTLLKLHDNGEILDYDFSILKVVIDMYDSVVEGNRQLRDKYKELKSLINKIYND